MWPKIGRRALGAGPVFAVAEIGLNHGGDVAEALALVDAAAWAGASAIKLQTLYADELVAPSCPAPAHVQAASLQDFFRTFELDVAAHRAIVARARSYGLAVLSTPFAVGDYGVVSQGLFQRMGNISEFGVQPGDGTSSESVGLISCCPDSFSSSV